MLGLQIKLGVISISMVLIVGLRQRILLDKKKELWTENIAIQYLGEKEEAIAKDEEEELQRNWG